MSFILDTSKVTDMSYMFFQNYSFNQPVPFNTQSCTNFSYMFGECANLGFAGGSTNVVPVYQSISAFNVAQATTMAGMFSRCFNFAGCDFSGWNTSNVTDMSFMFFGDTFFETTTIGAWSLQSIQTMANMLDGCTSLSPYDYSLILQQWYIDNTTGGNTLPRDISLGALGLFYLPFVRDIHNILTINYGWIITDSYLNSQLQLVFQVPAQTTIELPIQGLIPNTQLTVAWNDGTFYDEYSATHTYARAGTYVVTIDDTFTTFGGSGPWNGVQWVTQVGSFGGSIINLGYAFKGATRLVSMPDTLFSTVRVIYSMLSGTTAFTDANRSLATWDVSRILSFNNFLSGSAFQGALPWNMQNAQDLSYMFAYTTAFNDASIITWNTIKVTNMEGTFRGAVAFNQPLLWNTSYVTTIQDLFRDTVAFNQVLNTTTTWETSNVLNASGVFYGARAYNQPVTLRLASATTASSFFRNSIYNNNVAFLNNLNAVTDISYMFAGNTRFNNPNITSINFLRVTNYSHMFDGATAFNQRINWRTFSLTNQTLDVTACFQGATAFNQSVDLSIFKFTNCTIVFDSLFQGATAFNNFFNINFLVLPTNLSISMTAMFKNAVAYNGIFLSAQLVPAPIRNNLRFTSTAAMFQGATAYNQDMAIFGINLGSQVTDMSSMFEGATAFDRSLASFTMANVTNAANMLDLCAMSMDNYDATLKGWADQAPLLQTRVTLGAQGLVYDISYLPFRDILAGNFRWNIVGDSSFAPTNPSNPVLYKEFVTGGNDPGITKRMRYSQIVRNDIGGRTLLFK